MLRRDAAPASENGLHLNFLDLYDNVYTCASRRIRQKEAENRRKHLIGFELATEVFFDPLHVIAFDRVEDTEVRWHAIGHTKGAILLVVVHLVLDEEELSIRIISARKASLHEQEEYQDGYL